jgi:hypothetical protein
VGLHEENAASLVKTALHWNRWNKSMSLVVSHMLATGLADEVGYWVHRRGSRLVGYFGDGTIEAFDPNTGRDPGKLIQKDGGPFTQPGLRA